MVQESSAKTNIATKTVCGQRWMVICGFLRDYSVSLQIIIMEIRL